MSEAYQTRSELPDSRSRFFALSIPVRLALISFIILFFELTCIRWLSAYILYLGYFTNFVLLGALLGIGAGTLLASKPRQYIRSLPPAIFGLVVITLFTRAQINPEIDEIIFFTSTRNALQVPSFVMLPVLFALVCVIFTFAAQPLGRLLLELPPLRAYGLNIGGSLLGIVAFTVLSFLGAPSWVWFLVCLVPMVTFLPQDRAFGINVLLLFGTIIVVGASDFAFRNIWSPYYRLSLLTIDEQGAQRAGSEPAREVGVRYMLLANGAGHQDFSSIPDSKPFYQLPYDVLQEPEEYQNVLIVGSGGGNDLSFALANGAGHVDAVEIDPKIIQLGRTFHPAVPYSDPRVEVHIDDARSFMEKSTQRYNLIIFALPDSLVLATSMSSVRLESYLFTREAFESVDRLLAPNGHFVLYNYYRSDWLIDKLVSMVWEVFEAPILLHRFQDPESTQLAFATIIAGPRAAEPDLPGDGFSLPTIGSVPSATDDWPFLYLREASLPPNYALIIGLIFVFSVVYLLGLSPGSRIQLQTGWPYFFMGAAFMLLETKSIVQFLLLFGSTWVVNALVFFGILAIVLLANWIVMRFGITRIRLLFGLLLISLALNYLMPVQRIHFESVAARYLAASALMFSPIFFANLMFSALFRKASRANVAFGANLLGTMAGGSLEYLSLLVGYHNLVLMAGGFYLLAFYAALRKAKVGPGLAGSFARDD